MAVLWFFQMCLRTALSKFALAEFFEDALDRIIIPQKLHLACIEIIHFLLVHR
ncbi:hypothetical protein ES705_42628 [subsurface metagenome]